MELDIENLQGSYHVGPVLFITDKLKKALITEAGAWKFAYGKALNDKCAKVSSNVIMTVSMNC